MPEEATIPPSGAAPFIASPGAKKVGISTDLCEKNAKSSAVSGVPPTAPIAITFGSAASELAPSDWYTWYSLPAAATTATFK